MKLPKILDVGISGSGNQTQLRISFDLSKYDDEFNFVISSTGNLHLGKKAIVQDFTLKVERARLEFLKMRDACIDSMKTLQSNFPLECENIESDSFDVMMRYKKAVAKYENIADALDFVLVFEKDFLEDIYYKG